MLRPEDAAVYQQEVISHAELVAAVAEGTRNTFERLRLLHAYGVLSYDMFTAADDLAQLVIEQGLRDRFMVFHEGVVPFEDAHGTVHQVTAASFDALHDEIRAGRRLRGPRRWRLPVDSARSISDAAEIINHLWGSSTPGGRLYPEPVHRKIQIVAWGPDGSVMSGLASRPPAPQSDGWTCVLVRAVLHDDGLSRLDARYETTTYPCDLLWGPGSWEDASAWLKQAQPAEDDVDVLDRLFLMQRHEGHVYLPRSPDVAAGLTEEERQGTWYLIRADNPSDAIRHTARSSQASARQRTGPPQSHRAAVLGRLGKSLLLTSGRIPGCPGARRRSPGPALAGHGDVAVYPAQPALADKVVQERIGPVPLPGEPASQLGLRRQDGRADGRGDQVPERGHGVLAGAAAATRVGLIPAGQLTGVLMSLAGGDVQRS